jgi:flavodoxin I
LDRYQYLLLGSSTWGIGELQDDWLAGIGKFDKVDWVGKKAALFGTGDQQGYPDSFVDAVGALYEKLADKGAEVVGFWPVDGYEYDASRAEKDGRFVGLVIDEDNQNDLTEERINAWIEDLKVVMQS